MTNWRILDSGAGAPAWNMAVDEAIRDGVLRGDSPPTVRFYGWSPPAVSIGYHQEAEKEVDMERLVAHGWSFVRRPTGGRAVLHRDEVTYAVIAPIESMLGGSVNESYAAISEALACGLRLLGVQAELQRGSLSAASQREAANPCFSSTSRFELSVDGRKIVGSAQMRKDGVLLQHGSILLAHDQSAMAWLLPSLDDARRQRVEAYLGRKTVSVVQASGRNVSYDEAVQALKGGFQQTWAGCEFEISGELQAAERFAAFDRVRMRYGTDAWNWRK
ncbi:MAG: lipoate--protein ligase family protein [Candidatus Cloacimonetes bacterium]|nr:lipoate--protein ligase family protein [Candidatus Cloacimonadota bacterium]